MCMSFWELVFLNPLKTSPEYTWTGVYTLFKPKRHSLRFMVHALLLHMHTNVVYKSYAKTVPSRMKLTMKLTMREPASMTTDTWSRSVTSHFNSVLEMSVIGCSLQKFSYTWCKINKCQLAKKLHMVLINLHLVLAILFGLQCVLKVWIYTWWYGSGTSLHMVVVPFINVTLGARTKCVIHWRELIARSSHLQRVHILNWKEHEAKPTIYCFQE